MYITSVLQPVSARGPSSKALTGWRTEVGAAFSSIGGLPVGVVVKRRFKVAEADGLAFLGCSVSGRGFRIIVKDHDRSRYPVKHAPSTVEPAVHQPRMSMAARTNQRRRSELVDSSTRFRDLRFLTDFFEVSTTQSSSTCHSQNRSRQKTGPDIISYLLNKDFRPNETRGSTHLPVVGW